MSRTNISSAYNFLNLSFGWNVEKERKKNILKKIFRMWKKKNIRKRRPNKIAKRGPLL